MLAVSFSWCIFKTGKHNEGKCQRDYVCPHPMHQRYKNKKHVLLCEEHKDCEENAKILESYKTKCILRENDVPIPTYSKEIKLSFHAAINDVEEKVNNKDVIASSSALYTKDTLPKALYQLQIINVDGKDYSIFFDSGCGDFVSRKEAVREIGLRAKQIYDGPLQLGGVGGVVTESRHGIHSVTLPLYDDSNVCFSGICLDQITREFPMYPVQGVVEKEIHAAYRKSGGKICDLPKLPSFVGGPIDFMIGIKYLRYHPEKLF